MGWPNEGGSMKRDQQTERYIVALARIATGESPYSVGKDLGISLSWLYKLLKRRAQSSLPA